MIFNAQVTETVLGFDANLKQPGNLTFDQVDINIGGGFNGSTGVFTAPIAGIYKMTFSGQSAFNKFEITFIEVQKFDSTVFSILDDNEAENADANNVSFTWMMILAVGDEVKLRSYNNLYANYLFPLTFTGELIHIG